jgi:acetylornithine/N-succinyldiaminopimelate aminotransferase
MTSEKAQKIIDDTFKVLIKTYDPQPVVLDRGEGVYAYDTDGKKYVDCAAGIAVASLGHAHPAMLKTINDQAAKLMACQSSYATLPKLATAKLLVENSCFDRVYFSNSGTESVEAALKLVRKWAYETKGPECNEILAFRNSFHGRTYGSASITEKFHVQPFFAPYVGGIQWAKFNDLESVKALVSKKTAAIIVEPVQGEGGLQPATPEFLKGLRELCDKNDVALIFDEVQVGMGRIGHFFAYEHWGVEPDVATLAKGMGGGFPVGAMVAKERVGKHMEVGTHGTTYGGNPLACAVAGTVMSEILKPGFLENVRKVGTYISEGLHEIKRQSNKITDIRGMGLMIGIDSTVDIKKLMRALQDNGLMTTQAGKGTVRITPPLIIKEKQAEEIIDIIGDTLKEQA